MINCVTRHDVAYMEDSALLVHFGDGDSANKSKKGLHFFEKIYEKKGPSPGSITAYVVE